MSVCVNDGAETVLNALLDGLLVVNLQVFHDRIPLSPPGRSELVLS